jgi:hypothetical protein
MVEQEAKQENSKYRRHFNRQDEAHIFLRNTRLSPNCMSSHLRRLLTYFQPKIIWGEKYNISSQNSGGKIIQVNMTVRCRLPIMYVEKYYEQKSKYMQPLLIRPTAKYEISHI